MGKACKDRIPPEHKVLNCLKDVEKQSKWEMVPSKTQGKHFWLRCAVICTCTLLILLSITLATTLPVIARKSAPAFSRVCPDTWLGFQGRCYYFSSNESDWDSSRASCESVGASLASINSLDELMFIKRYKGPANHWFGLRKADDKSWRWTNGTAFDNGFEVRGGGPCAYLNEEKISSSLCHTQKRWLCSRLDNYVLWRRERAP